MKRKKWSEREERTLLNKYSDMQSSGALAKLKSREKKFKPIADHVNSIHHLHDPINFPFKWSWRDVSIKVQNMRHRYLGVKQKIRISDTEFNWEDGENHWENFLKYKEVFGDVELEVKLNVDSNNNGKRATSLLDPLGSGEFGVDGANDFFREVGLGFGIDSEEMEEEEDDDDDDEEEEEDFEVGEDLGAGVSDGELGGEKGEKEETEDSGGFGRGRKFRKGMMRKKIRTLGAQVLELRDLGLRREDKRREREWNREEGLMEREQRRREREILKERRDSRRDEELEMREMEIDEWQMKWARREIDKRLRLERELYEERRKRMRLEERWEEEKMEWREKMVQMQIEHEKQMMQMYADSYQNQMQVLGVISRLLCQFFGSASDGLGTLPPQELQNLQHSGALGDSGKPDSGSPSEFL